MDEIKIILVNHYKMNKTIIIFAQNFDSAYTEEPPRRQIKNRYTLVLLFLKVGFRGVYISCTCYPDA